MAHGHKRQVRTVENVPEFTRWGPLDDDGKPIKKRAGEYFAFWVRTPRSLGYDLDWQIINAADYGEATSRKRFFLQARNDGRPKYQTIRKRSGRRWAFR